MAAKKGGLGRGLDALFADAVPVTNPEPEVKETKSKTSYGMGEIICKPGV